MHRHCRCGCESEKYPASNVTMNTSTIRCQSCTCLDLADPRSGWAEA